MINDAMTDLRNDVDRKNINWNEQPDKLIDIGKRIFYFIKQVKGRPLKYKQLNKWFNY